MVMRTQTLVQLTDDLLAQLDERAAREGRSRSGLIRDALRAYLADDVAAQTDRQLVEGYTRVPQTTAEAAWAEDAARRAVEAEPW
jgi:metal-responsive CopG/Arc/MetJ family transcriptional regulator